MDRRALLRLLQETSASAEESHTLDGLARHTGISKFHLQREYKRTMGETPKQFINRIRLERAASMLKVSDESVLTIALAAGFHSHEVFVRAFRRRFLRSPTQYRAMALRNASEDEITRHAELVRSVGQCTHLFHFRITNEERRSPMAQPEITRVELDPQPILFIQRRVPRDELQSLFSECFMKLFQYAMQNGLAIAGRPTARYVEVGTGLWTVDSCVPVAATAETEGEIQAGTLQGGPAARAIHLGPYEDLYQTYVAIERWTESNGYSSNGAAWESYVTDPGEEQDSAKWRTDVYWPITDS